MIPEHFQNRRRVELSGIKPDLYPLDKPGKKLTGKHRTVIQRTRDKNRIAAADRKISGNIRYVRHDILLRQHHPLRSARRAGGAHYQRRMNGWRRKHGPGYRYHPQPAVCIGYNRLRLYRLKHLPAMNLPVPHRQRNRGHSGGKTPQQSHSRRHFRPADNGTAPEPVKLPGKSPGKIHNLPVCHRRIALAHLLTGVEQHPVSQIFPQRHAHHPRRNTS